MSQMTNEVGKAMFAKAGELGAPVGFLCMKVLQFGILHVVWLFHNYICCSCKT